MLDFGVAITQTRRGGEVKRYLVPGVLAATFGAFALAQDSASDTGSVGTEGEEQTTCHEGDSAEPAASWVGSAQGGFSLQMTVKTGLVYRADIVAQLGRLQTSWAMADLVPNGEGILSITIQPPPAAFLDPAALDYVTDLRVHVVGSDSAAVVRFRANAPSAVLVWPSGQSSSPIVWDAPTMRSQAPAGVLNADIRATIADLAAIDRVIVPVGMTVPPPAADASLELPGDH